MARTKKQVTSSGFEYELDPKRLDNYELVEIISEVDTNPLVFPKLLKLLLGDAQTQALKDHVRDDQDLVSTEKMMAEVQEIFKNSAVKK